MFCDISRNTKQIDYSLSELQKKGFNTYIHPKIQRIKRKLGKTDNIIRITYQPLNKKRRISSTNDY